MANWRKSRVYCYGCGRWYDGITHRGCPEANKWLGTAGLTWVDIEGFWMGCDGCKEVWKLENNIFYCHNGHEQKTFYSDEAVAVEKTDRIIATDGDTVYVLKRSGAVVVGRRQYHGMSYRA